MTVKANSVTLDHLTEPPSDLPPVERTELVHLSAVQRHWAENGYVLLRKLIPDDVIDAYCDAWRETNDEATGKSRWPACAYMHSEAILDLCLHRPLVAELGPILGGKVGLHLCLTGWRSTTRDWHQDDYLNPPFVNAWYAAAWIALDDIHRDSGPFELVVGSHKWPRLRRERILRELHLDPGDSDWPRKTEEQLTPLVEAEIEKRGVTPTIFALDRGDVLIWHGGLYHRGTVARDPERERRACIAHYSAVHKRIDMNAWMEHGSGHYFHQPQPLTDGRFAP